MDLREELLKAYHAKSGQAGAAVGSPMPALPELEQAVCIAVINQKGGCGKTTTAVNLSTCLAEVGYRVLLVDMDPQAHATLGVGLNGEEMEIVIYHILLRKELPLAKGIQGTFHRNLKLLPANGLLASAQMELLSVPQRDQILKTRLKELEDLFDFILIDCPPSLNVLTINALTAANRVLIPIQTQFYSLDGMRELFKTIELVRENSNPQLSILGILPTLFDPRTKLNRSMLQALKEYFKEQLFDSPIHLNAALAECPMMGQPVTRYAPGSRGAGDYRRLTGEVLARVARSARSQRHSAQTL